MDSFGWMTDEVSQALDAIKEPHREKKRMTVILMAVAAANNQSEASVLTRADTCDDTVWSGRWIGRDAKRHWKTGWKAMPDVVSALELCKREALRWRDTETIRLETFYAQERRKAVAEFSADAPVVLADIMVDRNQRAADRRAAANDLMGWSDPDRAEKVRPSPAGDEPAVNSIQIIIPDNGRGDARAEDRAAAGAAD